MPRSVKYGIYNAKGELLEGGFFSKHWAEETRDRDYPGCSVKVQE